MAPKIRRWAHGLQWMVIAAALGAVGSHILAPRIAEWRAPPFEPVLALEFDDLKCDGDDLVARGWMIKNWVGYGRAEPQDKRTAEITGFWILDAGPDKSRLGDIIAFERLRGGNSLVDRDAGFQYIALRLFGHCGRPFKIKTRHLHPLDRDVTIQRTYGPWPDSG